jgi:hypothetical protein
MQDTSYSPVTFSSLDSKIPVRGNELKVGSMKNATKQSSKSGGMLSAFFPQPPKFPTLFELARTAEPPTKKNSPGLFETYLSRDPAHILQDARTQEARYDDQVLSLLGELYEGTKKWENLKPAEHHLLDEAALEFLSPAKRTAAPSSLAPNPPAAAGRANMSPPKPEPVEGPVMDAFWWSR